MEETTKLLAYSILKAKLATPSRIIHAQRINDDTVEPTEGEARRGKGVRLYSLNDFFGARLDNGDHSLSVAVPPPVCREPQGTGLSPLTRRAYP